MKVDCKMGETGRHAWKKCKGLEWERGRDEEGRMKMRGRAETEHGEAGTE